MALDAFPVLGSFLAFGQVQFCHQFLTTLQRDVLAVVVIISDNVLLIFGVLSHRILDFRRVLIQGVNSTGDRIAIIYKNRRSTVSDPMNSIQQTNIGII